MTFCSVKCFLSSKRREQVGGKQVHVSERMCLMLFLGGGNDCYNLVQALYSFFAGVGMQKKRENEMICCLML